MSRRTPFAATLVALPVLLGGCGLGQSVAGIHDAPTESSDGAAITEGTGRDVAARVLDRAAERREEGAKATAEDRAELFSGPARREADAAARTGDDGGAAEEHEDLTVLGISRGSDWPRAVLATSRDGDVQRLHVLVSEDADRAYTLFADVPMAAGASVPALAPVAEGSPATVSGAPDEAVISAADAWAKGVAYPAPSTTPSGVSLEDAFSSALAKNAKAEDEDLDDLADYRQRQARVDADSVTFDLAGGGQLSFLPMTRTDTITASGELKELKIEDSALEGVLDAATVEDSLSIKHAETLALVTPGSGTAKVVGVSDVLHSATGS